MHLPCMGKLWQSCHDLRCDFRVHEPPLAGCHSSCSAVSVSRCVSRETAFLFHSPGQIQQHHTARCFRGTGIQFSRHDELSTEGYGNHLAEIHSQQMKTFLRLLADLTLFHVEPSSFRPPGQIQRSRINRCHEYLRTKLGKRGQYPGLVSGIQFTGEII